MININHNISKKSVCFILPVPLFPLFGPSYRCYRQAIALKTRGIKVSIISLRIKGKNRKGHVAESDEIFLMDCLPNIGSGVINHITTLLFSWSFLLIALLKIKPDIIHVHNPPDIIAFMVSIVNRVLRKELILDMNDPGPESIESHPGLKNIIKPFYHKFSCFLEKHVLSNAKAVITINNVLKRLVLETRRELLNKPVVTIYNSIPKRGYDSEFHSSPREDNYVLYVGTLTSGLLGLHDIIRSFHKVWKRYGVRLLIVGDGPLRSELEIAIKDFDAERYIEILGRVDHNITRAFIENAKLCIIPYVDTVLTRLSTPTKLFDFLSCGKVIVCPDFPGFREVLGANNAGLYRSDRADNAVDKISDLLGNSDLLELTGNRNRELFESYTYDKQIERLTELYSSITMKHSLEDVSNKLAEL